MIESIPVFSARAANASIDLLTPVKRVLDGHRYVLGKEVTEFEREFARYIGVANCVGVANGTDSLELALRALDVQLGDRVIVVANAGFYGSAAVRLIGAIPRYVDIDPVTLTMSVEGLREALQGKAKAVIVTHLFGRLADMDQILKAASKAGVPVIEDCAQAHGAKRDAKRAGSFGTIGCFSFYPTKNLGALGDGGALVTHDDSLAAHVRQLRQYGWGMKYRIDSPRGRNSRLDELQAAVLREKLPYLDRWNDERREIARCYNASLSDLPFRLPSSLGEDFVAHLYVVRVNNRDAFRSFLSQNGVSTDVHYPIPDHLQPAYSCEQKEGDLPVTEEACKAVVSLPCFPGLSKEEIAHITSAVRRYFEQDGA